MQYSETVCKQGDRRGRFHVGSDRDDTAFSMSEKPAPRWTSQEAREQLICSHSSQGFADPRTWASTSNDVLCRGPR